MAYAIPVTGQPIIAFDENRCPRGPINRLVGNTSDYLCQGLAKVAGSANVAIGSVNGQLDQMNNLRNADIAAATQTVSVVNAHSGYIQTLDSRLKQIENVRGADVTAQTQTVTVVDALNAHVKTLLTDSSSQSQRIATLETMQGNTREFAVKSVSVIDLHTVHIETLTADGRSLKTRVEALEPLSSKQEAQSHRITLLKEALNSLSTESQASIRHLHLLLDEAVVNQRALGAEVGLLEQSNKTLIGRFVELRKDHEDLKKIVDILMNFKNQAEKQHERHENILLHAFRLQVSLAETFAEMGKEQQMVFANLQGMNQNIARLVEKMGLPVAQIELPLVDPAPFRSILDGMKSLRQALEQKV